MGEIIECIDRNLQRKVVVKRLQGGVDERRILDEQKALSTVRSKHVVQMFDVVSIDDEGGINPAIVLEHIDGANLAPAAFKVGEDYLKTLWQIASGLSDIHAANVVHRE